MSAARPQGVSPDGLALALVALSAAASACFVSSDGDLGFHLATGREVLRSGAIPARNVLSFTEPEHAWRLHQWLPAVLLELLHRSAGIAAVIALKMAVVAATWTFVYRAARRLGATPFVAAPVCLLAIAASAFRFESRPYLFTHLTLAVVLWLAAPLLPSATSPAPAGAPRRRTVLAIAAVIALGLQLHASIDGLLVLLLLAAGCLFQPLHERVLGAAPLAGPAARDALPPLIAAGIGLALGSLALQLYHPIGASMLGFAFEMGSDAYLAEHLVEFRPLYRFPLALLPLTWVFLLAVLFVVVARRRVLHAAELVLVLAFALLALRLTRMAYAFAIVAAPVAAAALARAPLRLPALRPGLRAFALIACALAPPLYVYRDHTPGFGYAPTVWPLDHFAFIREHRIAGHAFVSNAWAGPFLGTFYPERKSFFDMRLEAYSKTMLREVYQGVAYGKPGWDRLLERHRVELLLLRYTSPGEAALQGGAPNLRQHLARDPRFALVRFDDHGALFVRTAGPNAALAARYAMPCVDPDRRVFTRQPDAACIRGLQTAMLEGNHAGTLLLLTAVALAAREPSPPAVALAEQAIERGADDPWAHRALAFARCRAARRADCAAP